MRYTWKKVHAYTDFNEKGMDLFVNWVYENHITHMCERIALDIPAFITGEIIPRKHRIINRPPYNDHAMQFKDVYGNLYYTYHPYKTTEDIEDDVLMWARRNDIKAEIFNPELSWYNPGETCLIILKNKRSL